MSEDTIYREDAIKALEQRYEDILRIFKRKVKVGEKALALDFIGCVKALPSADRPQGEWIDKGKNLWKCSNCEMVIYSESEQDRNEFHKWCSRCGARMFAKDINVPNKKKGVDDEISCR